MTKNSQDPNAGAPGVGSGGDAYPWYRESPDDVRRAGSHGPEAVLKRPGHARFSQQATDMLGAVGMERAGTKTPFWARLTRDAETNAGIFLVPCKAGTPDALPIDYIGNGNLAAMKLTGPCRAYNYHIPKSHNAVVPVSILTHSIHGQGLFLDFANRTERPVRRLGPVHLRRLAKQQQDHQLPAQAPDHTAPDHPTAPDHQA